MLNGDDCCCRLVVNLLNEAEIYVDSSGRWFEASLVDDSFCFLGSSFNEAMERLLLGRRYRPIFRPDQDKLSMYGEILTVDHPTVYKYR